MASTTRIPLGAPGIYPYPDTPLRALTGVRLDVCAFVGVAPRGPAREPVINEKWRDDRPCVEPERPRRRTVAVAVESFDEYRQLYGEFDGPGLLPYAVASFFEQGGRRAYIARIVHEYGDPDQNSAGVASGVAPGTKTPLRLQARNEGSWGNRLRAALSFSSRPLPYETIETTGLRLDEGTDISEGALLRLTLSDGTRLFRFVANIAKQGRPSAPGSELIVTFTAAMSQVAETVEVVEGTLLLDDGAGHTERFDGLGLSLRHPRWLATVLCYESLLVYPAPEWINTDLEPTSPDLVVEPASFPQFGEFPSPSTGIMPVIDRYAEISSEDFFDTSWTFGDGEPGNGVQVLAGLAEVSALVAPDLYSPMALAPIDAILDPISFAGPEFARCVDAPLSAVAQESSTPDLEQLRLDPQLPAELNQIISLQKRLVEFAELLRSFIVLLDVPPRLNQRKILSWRASFNSSYAAAYHPWLQVARLDDQRNALIHIPPSAVAAGIIAQRELALGVPHGPANVLAAGVVDIDEIVSPARHDELHPAGINVYLRERDGIRLTAARTLSRDLTYRQLSVRRLMLLLRKTLEERTQWVVFEPNNAALRAEIRHLLRSYLSQLFTIGAFRGATEDEAFFIRCDEILNSQRIVDAGQLIAEIGVAPTEPIEFILLRLARDGDGTLTVQEQTVRGMEL
jgi:hypothetical protein